jgi:hypothetical protein
LSISEQSVVNIRTSGLSEDALGWKSLSNEASKQPQKILLNVTGRGLKRDTSYTRDLFVGQFEA